jgi:aconitate hydratase
LSRKERQARGTNLAHKLIASHLAEGRMEVDAAIGLTIDQTLTQDATGTLVMLEFEGMRLPRVKTEWRGKIKGSRWGGWA